MVGFRLRLLMLSCCPCTNVEIDLDSIMTECVFGDVLYFIFANVSSSVSRQV